MSEDLQEYLDQLETVQTELLDDPENAELVTLRDELLELIQLLQDDTNADDDQEEEEETGKTSGDKDEVVEDEGDDEEEAEKADAGVESGEPELTIPRPPASVPKPPPPSSAPPKPASVPRPPPGHVSSASPTPPPVPAPPAESRGAGDRPALQSQNALAPKKKKSKWEKQEEALDATKNKWQKFSQKANGGRASMFQSPSDASGKGEYCVLRLDIGDCGGYGLRFPAMAPVHSFYMRLNVCQCLVSFLAVATEKPFYPRDKRLRYTYEHTSSAARHELASQQVLVGAAATIPL